MSTRPLGIADLNRAYVQVKYQDLPDHWYWCRRHERAEHAGDKPTDRVIGESDWSDCIRIGPFMSEKEANRCGGTTRHFKFLQPLGMEIEK